MDALSHLIQLARMRVQLDVRCQLSGGFVLPHAQEAASGDAPADAVFHLVLAGRCRMRVAGSNLYLRAGDLVLLPQGSAHRLTQAGRAAGQSPLQVVPGAVLPLKTNRSANEQGAADVDLLCGRFQYLRGAGQLLAAWLPPVVQVSLLPAQAPAQAPTQEPAAAALLQGLVAGLRAESAGAALPGAYAVLDGLGQALLGLALRAYAAQSQADVGLLVLLADERLAPAVQAVLAQTGERWTLETLAAQAAMSRATFARRFQARAGFAVAPWLLRVRCMHACVLLTQTEQSIASIAEAVGYGSEAAFATAFKREMGETPGRWRRGRSAAGASGPT